MAQAAGIAAIESIPYYRDTLHRIKQLKTTFFDQLHEIGYPLVHSKTHFGIINVEQSAYAFRQALLKQAIQVRDCTSFGLPEYIRISTQKEEHNQKLLQILKKEHHQ